MMQRIIEGDTEQRRTEGERDAVDLAEAETHRCHPGDQPRDHRHQCQQHRRQGAQGDHQHRDCGNAGERAHPDGLATDDLARAGRNRGCATDADVECGLGFRCHRFDVRDGLCLCRQVLGRGGGRHQHHRTSVVEAPAGVAPGLRPATQPLLQQVAELPGGIARQHRFVDHHVRAPQLRDHAAKGRLQRRHPEVAGREPIAEQVAVGEQFVAAAQRGRIRMRQHEGKALARQQPLAQALEFARLDLALAVADRHDQQSTRRAAAQLIGNQLLFRRGPGRQERTKVGHQPRGQDDGERHGQPCRPERDDPPARHQPSASSSSRRRRPPCGDASKISRTPSALPRTSTRRGCDA